MNKTDFRIESKGLCPLGKKRRPNRGPSSIKEKKGDDLRQLRGSGGWLCQDERSIDSGKTGSAVILNSRALTQRYLQ